MYEVQGTLTCPPNPTPPHQQRRIMSRSNNTRDLCSVAHYNVRSTRNVDMPPPTHPTPKTCVLRARFSVRRQKHLYGKIIELNGTPCQFRGGAVQPFCSEETACIASSSTKWMRMHDRISLLNVGPWFS